MRGAFRQLIRDGRNQLKYLRFKSALPKNPMHDDIYIVEFPKSGVTFFSHIVGNIELLLEGRNEFVSFYNHQKYVIDVHQAEGRIINRSLGRTFIKSHARYCPYYYFVVYLIRNPFDVMVSYYNLLIRKGYKESFETFVKSPVFGVASWKKHVNGWNGRPNIAQRMNHIRYEDLVRSPKEEVAALYLNLGVELPDETLDRAIELSGLDHMRKSEKHYMDHNLNYNMSFVGKAGKLKKEELLTNPIRDFIQTELSTEIAHYYPEGV